jgi:putative transcriptional regulator
MILLLMLAMLQPPPVGQVLVATEKSHDPDLAKSVVLVIHSDSEGVMGLILNRPRGKSTYFGGPIPLGTRALSRNKAEQILPGVYLSAGTKNPTARIYEGYTGWSPQQLTDEISRGLWRVVSGTASMVFDPHPETLWQRLR